MGSEDPRSPPVFISYATADRAEALKVCKAIEGRGTRCWISVRDVPPGANYQEAIVQSLRAARSMVLVFSAAANTSDEIKKELSLASRYGVPVIALRLEDVQPSDAFAYELSTRQWINAFEGWDKAIDTLVSRIGQIAGSTALPSATAIPSSRRAANFPSGRVKAIAAGLLLVMAAAGAWWALRPSQAASHTMSVRLAGFQLLSEDLPATLGDTVGAEIAAAFSLDGVVSVSTAAAPPPGAAPAYALGGTIQRDGDSIRVITRMFNEHSGETLWSDTFDYDGNEVARVPRHIAVDAGNVVRCGLFGASTYDKPLPDTVLRDYMQFCQGHWNTDMAEGRLALIPAQRVVAAVPDFSWGWAAIAGAYWKVASSASTRQIGDAARASGREAADRAVAIDPRNSEALYIKAVLLDPRDLLGREDLFKRAVAARRLDCGCEHHQYGGLLLYVGRIGEAVEHLHQASNMLSLYVYTALSLADGLVVAGKAVEAKRYFDSAIDLAPNAGFAKGLMAYKATSTDDLNLLLDPTLPLPPDQRAALVQGHRAMASRDPAARAQAVKSLLALAEGQQTESVARLLAALGATQEAFLIGARLAKPRYSDPSFFWHPDMRATLDNPEFPALVTELGLLEYWKKSGTKPDVCNKEAAPPFCAMI